MAAWKLTLREQNGKGCLNTHKDYQPMVNGSPVGDAFYRNMTGWRGALPTPTGGKLDLPELSVAQLRKEVAALNKEAKAIAQLAR